MGTDGRNAKYRRINKLLNSQKNVFGYRSNPKRPKRPKRPNYKDWLHTVKALFRDSVSSLIDEDLWMDIFPSYSWADAYEAGFTPEQAIKLLVGPLDDPNKLAENLLMGASGLDEIERQTKIHRDQLIEDAKGWLMEDTDEDNDDNDADDLKENPDHRYNPITPNHLFMILHRAICPAEDAASVGEAQMARDLAIKYLKDVTIADLPRLQAVLFRLWEGPAKQRGSLAKFKEIYALAAKANKYLPATYLLL